MGEETLEQAIMLVDLAGRLGFNSASIKKAVMNRGFTPIKLKDQKNAPWYLFANDAEDFVACIEGERKRVSMPLPSDAPPCGLSGVYAVLAPSYTGASRVKIGWSDDVQARLQTHRCLVPDLKVLAIWATHHAWLENMALLWAKRQGKQISAEVFEFHEAEDAVARLGAVFAEMGILSMIDSVQ